MKFDLNDVVKGVAKELATKRAILSTIARVFDPHGLIFSAQLMTSTVNALYRVITIYKVYCWCDSQIVLWWLYGLL